MLTSISTYRRFLRFSAAKMRSTPLITALPSTGYLSMSSCSSGGLAHQCPIAFRGLRLHALELCADRLALLFAELELALMLEHELGTEQPALEPFILVRLFGGVERRGDCSRKAQERDADDVRFHSSDSSSEICKPVGEGSSARSGAAS